MARVFKYTLPSQVPRPEVPLPAGAQLLSVGLQAGALRVWALVDPDAAETTRRFQVAATGHTTVEPGARFVGTVFDGPYVWHIFDLGEDA